MEIIQKIVTPENILFMLKAAGMSILVAVCSLSAGTVLGVLNAAAKLGKNNLLKGIATCYVELIRGTPMMLQILFFYLAGPMIVKAVTGSGFTPNPFVVGILAISINSGAYSTELIRSAIQSIDKGQWEAAKALGLNYRQMMRFVILPQSFKRILPPWISEFITLIKDSSLISTIGAVELLRSAQMIGVHYYNYIVPLVMATVIYLCVTITIAYFAGKLEKRLAESD